MRRISTKLFCIITDELFSKPSYLTISVSRIFGHSGAIGALRTQRCRMRKTRSRVDNAGKAPVLWATQCLPGWPSWDATDAAWLAHAPLVQWFWEILAEFTNQERSLFLRFVWGRTRLPRSSIDFRGKPYTSWINSARKRILGAMVCSQNHPN